MGFNAEQFKSGKNALDSKGREFRYLGSIRVFRNLTVLDKEIVDILVSAYRSPERCDYVCYFLNTGKDFYGISDKTDLIAMCGEK